MQFARSLYKIFYQKQAMLLKPHILLHIQLEHIKMVIASSFSKYYFMLSIQFSHLTWSVENLVGKTLRFPFFAYFRYFSILDSAASFMQNFTLITFVASFNQMEEPKSFLFHF